jgi:type I restriction enzyme, S subunit
MVNWEPVLLEDLAAPTRNALVGGPFGSNLVAADYQPTGVPVIRGENVNCGRWIGGDFVYVSHEKAEQLTANKAHALDVIFTQRGENHYRQVAIVGEDNKSPFIISQSQMKITVDKDKVLPLFLYYLFRAPEQQQYLKSNAIQVGVPHTNLAILRRTPLRIPQIHEQQRIVALLGALDDKIELNERMSRTLEAMARALFQSWFVDFEPVRRAAAGEDHGLPGAIAAFFPRRLTESELPEGWTSYPVKKIATITKGSSYRSEDLVAGASTALVTLKSFARGGGYRPDGLKPFTGKFKSAQRVEPGELVVAATDVTQAADVVGQPVLVEPSDRFNTLVGSLDTFIVRPSHAGLSSVHLHGLLRAAGFPVFARGYVTGTTVLHLSSRVFDDFEVVLPGAQLLEAFGEVLLPLHARMLSCVAESAALGKLRDMLLPKLISGELPVSDAETITMDV